MRKGERSLKPYFAIAGCFLLMIVALKLIEFFIAGIDTPKRFQLLINALVYNCVIVSWVILGVGIIYWLVSLLSNKVANAIVATFYGLFLVSEVGLMIYAMHNGYALGSELFARPLSESLMAIAGAMGVVMPIVLTLVLLGGSIALALWRARKAEVRDKMNKGKGLVVVPIIAVLFMLMSMIFKTQHLLTFGINNYFVFNKTHYLVTDGIQYFKYWKNSSEEDFSTMNLDELKLTEDELDELIATHPEWGTPLDREYPLERAFVADTFLNQYFKFCEEQGVSPDGEQGKAMPNIVIILVESMGHEYMERGAMPFVDSMARTGLYWPNCLSTTTRSYGAIPAITGSVGGPKSFQFGTMPGHNSLLSLLKKEGYNTRAYYGGDFTFDCIYEYLSEQRNDYFSPFYEEYKATNEANDGYWWGAGDDYLFKNTIKNLNEEVGRTKNGIKNEPFVALITTLSMHDKLKLNDRKQQAYYEQRAKKTAVTACSPKVAESEPTALFTDDQIKEFIHKYSQREDFANTIFVVTGDHASGRQQGDKLSYHHVPLIIWSPLVKRPARFSHIVTHNDIAPALYSLMSSHYGLKAQPTIHWLGDGLASTPKTILVVNYMHEITDIIYQNHYYESGTKFTPEAAYSFDSNMVLKPDNQAIDDCKRQLGLMTKLLFYTYYADRLTAHPIFGRDYILSRKYTPEGDIVCKYPNQPPSKVGNKAFVIFPNTQFIPKKGFSTIRVNIEADVTVSKSINMFQYPELRFCHTSSSELKESDRLNKFFATNGTDAAGTYHLSLSKEFPISETTPSIISVELSTPYYDEDYVSDVTITLSNVDCSIYYGKTR